MLDGATDRVAEELILCARYMKNSGMREVFMSVLLLDNETRCLLGCHSERNGRGWTLD